MRAVTDRARFSGCVGLRRQVYAAPARPSDKKGVPRGGPSCYLRAMAETGRAGFVAIVGLPNVGKSTLLNLLLGQKIAIVAPKPQTTRNRILGVKNLPGAQLVLVDTPGIHRPAGRARTALNRFMMDEALGAVADVDAIALVVEVPESSEQARIRAGGYRLPKSARFILDTLREANKPTVLVINKVDLLRDKGLLLPVLEAWSAAFNFRALVPISALRGEGEKRLTQELVALLPEGDRLFPEEMITDRAERWLAAEMVREQVFLLTRQEVPYAVAVTIDEFEERPARGERPADVMLSATVHVEKEAQKRIVVGEGGRMVKEIGTRARAEIEGMLDCPVHLRLFVRVDADWTQKPGGLRDMGYE